MPESSTVVYRIINHGILFFVYTCTDKKHGSMLECIIFLLMFFSAWRWWKSVQSQAGQADYSGQLLYQENGLLL